jgi:hypothetical protein
MTPRQVVAIELPCARAWETLRPEFRRLLAWKNEVWSTILSVNK